MQGITKILKFITNEFIYSGHLQSLGSVAIVFLSATLLKIKITWDCLVIVYLTFYLIYLYNRLKEINVDYLTNPERTRHLKTYIRQIPIIIYLLIPIIIAGLIYFSNVFALIFTLLLLMLGFLYTISFKKTTGKIVALKDLYVATVFSLLAIFPVIYYSYTLKNSSVVSILITFMVFIYFKVLMMQLFLDLKDLESDKLQGLLTIPVMLGREKTTNILKIANILVTAIIPIFFSIYLDIFPKSMLFILLIIPFNLYCLYLAQKQKYIGYILESAELILWPFLVLIGEVIL